MARIAMLLTNSFTRDARVEREARTLAEAGHEVRVFCLAGEGLPADERRDGYSILRLEPPGWVTRGGLRRVLPLARWYSRFGFLARAAAEWGPGVIHGHDLDTLLPAAATARRLGIPHVHDDHELGLDKLGQGEGRDGGGPRAWARGAVLGYLRWRGRRLESRWIPRTAALITVNALCGEVLEERHGRAATILRNVPWRSDLPPDPRLRERAGVPPETRIALYQGMVTPVGGAEECIRAVREFPDGWILAFLGVSWMRSRLETLAKEEGVGDRVRFLDRVSPAELPGFTRAADLGLAPMRPANLGQRYSLANKIFEYLHAGLPMVVSDLPLQAAIVRDLDAGIVLAEIAPGAIAAAVAAVAGIPEGERRERAARLRTVARERHSWETERKGLLDLYERVLAGR